MKEGYTGFRDIRPNFVLLVKDLEYFRDGLVSDMYTNGLQSFRGNVLELRPTVILALVTNRENCSVNSKPHAQCKPRSWIDCLEEMGTLWICSDAGALRTLRTYKSFRWPIRYDIVRNLV